MKLEILRAFEEIINQNESLMILLIVLKINECALIEDVYNWIEN